ncbi:recombinase RecT [uncultured Duncaniella sp.]|uniref:recombinase RecT n=2 Tax=Muribaculaceae TaxID=2005473 RepID=UPI002598A8F1|nr:recombinase RecT [uncultured Duncaniella sp.]
MGNINLTVEEINRLEPTAIATNELVRAKFIQIYEAMWTPSTGVSGEAAYERESRYFNRLLGEKEDLRKNCTRFSLFTAFLDVAISGLTLEPGTRAQAYLLSRSIAVDSYLDQQGNKKNKYETQCILTVSGYGELILRARCGQIRHADNPVIVYAEDGFEYGERNGNKFVNYTCRLPHTSGEIVACFMKITRADGSIDYAVMLPEDWSRLAGFSARQNRQWDNQRRQWVMGNPNALYGQQQDGTLKIDTGFLIAKCIKHAFKTYPKARVGRGTQLESQQVDEVEINDDIYGLEDGSSVNRSTGEVMPSQDTGFAPAPDTSAGVRVNPETSSSDAGGSDDTF